ncbi:hypothetical protein ASD12_09650 [Mesorhizobium sp. Root102]|nr:hypothetical protein ASD12_09650 [Mesorhizobium sp. Root102]
MHDFNGLEVIVLLFRDFLQRGREKNVRVEGQRGARRNAVRARQVCCRKLTATRAILVDDDGHDAGGRMTVKTEDMMARATPNRQAN